MRIVIPDDFPPVYQGHPQLERLAKLGGGTLFNTKAASPRELVDRLAGAAVAINVRSYSLFDAAVLRALPELKLLSILGTGTDNVDLNAATELGIVVTNTPGASTVSVAELTLALMLSAARHVALADRKVREGVWYHQHGFELRGKTLGVVGLGLIGQEVARLGKALGMSVLAWSFRQDEQRAAAVGASQTELDDLLRRSDVVTLHVRASAQTAGLIGKRELGLLKPTAILINTARASVVDQDALIAALQEKRLAAAALDVFPIEPIPADSPLLKLDNVVLSPHVGWVTNEASERLAQMPVDNIVAYLEGRPQHVVNPAALEHPRQKA